MELVLLCWEFFKTGLFAVGGGMATIPFLTRMSEKHPHWFTIPMLTDMIAVSESTPGPIGVNMATYVGYIVAGIHGGFLATFSLVLPSFIILILISRALQKYRSNKYINAGFVGLRPAVTGLIAAAAYSVLQMTLFANFNFVAFALFAMILACTQVKKLSSLHPVVYIGFSAVIGIVFAL